MRSHVENSTRNVGYVTISAQIESEIPSHTTSWESGRNRSVGGTRCDEDGGAEGVHTTKAQPGQAVSGEYRDDQGD